MDGPELHGIKGEKALTPHELRVRVQIKGKVKAKPSNPQHFLPPSLSGRPFRVVRSACTPFVIYRPPSQYTLWAVHLGPSGVPATHTLIPLPYIPPLRHSPGRPFRAVRSAIAVPHPNSPTPIPPPRNAPGRPFRAVRSVCHCPPPRPPPTPVTPSLTRGRPFRAVSSDIHLHRHHPSYLTQPHHLPHVIAPGRPFRAVRSCYTSTSSSSILPSLTQSAS